MEYQQEKKKTLIFEPCLTGHHLEYLHHYYMGAIAKSENEYIIAVPTTFESLKSNYKWPKANNITFHYLTEQEINETNDKNVYKQGWKCSKLLRKKAREFKPNKVILTMLMQYIPFICILLPTFVKVSGIMYKIYLYEEKNLSFFRLLAEKVRFWIASRSNTIESIYVLNDEDSASEFNHIYHTNKFKFISDPVPEVDFSMVKDLHDALSIPKTNKVFLHFGGLDKRKGTIDILNVIERCNSDKLRNFTFRFAGKQKPELRETFFPMYERIKGKCQILIFDEFCSYDFLYNLCFTCDSILMPYHITNLSSGVLGYAALFKKPVIGPSGGVIGRLINKYMLGVTTVNELDDIIMSDISCSADGCNTYVNKNHKSNFIKTII